MEGQPPPPAKPGRNEKWIDVVGDNSICLLAKFNEKHMNPISNFDFFLIQQTRPNIIVSGLLKNWLATAARERPKTRSNPKVLRPEGTYKEDCKHVSLYFS